MRRLAALVVVAAITSLGLVAISGPAQATFPGQNGRIAFQGEKPSGTAIYTMNPNGTGLRRLTPRKGEALTPDWSPNGRLIAVAQHECRVAIMRADGTHRRVLPSKTPGGCETDPSFTPDGSRLVYVRFDPPDDEAVWIMNLDGTNRQRITAPNVGAPDPNVSPNGRKVSFIGAGKPERRGALFTASLNGSNLFRVTPFLGVGFKSDWAPDGRHIVITTHIDSPKSPNVATVRPDGSQLRMLTHYKGGAKAGLAGSYSPNGRWIVFRFEDPKQEKFRVYKMSPNGSHRKLIRRFHFATRNLDWGPRR